MEPTISEEEKQATHEVIEKFNKGDLDSVEQMSQVADIKPFKDTEIDRIFREWFQDLRPLLLSGRRNSQGQLITPLNAIPYTGCEKVNAIQEYHGLGLENLEPDLYIKVRSALFAVVALVKSDLIKMAKYTAKLEEEIHG